MNKLFLKNKEYIFLLPIIILSAVLIALCIKDGHNWSGDYALYIEQTKALLNCSMDQLYALNKYSTDRAFRVQGPYLYPMGFPVLLSVPYYFVGVNFIVMKLFCTLFFLIGLLLFYKLFRPYFSHFLYPICMIAVMALHYEFIHFCDNVLSDLPFFFFTALCFLQMRKENSFTNQIILGVLIFFSYYVRDVGIVFLPTLLVYHCQLIFIEKKKEKNSWYYLLPYFIFIGFYLLNGVVFPKGNTNHYEFLLSRLSWELVAKNGTYYTNIFADFFFYIKPVFLLFLFLPMLTGMFFSLKKQLYFIAFVILVLIVHLIWPAYQGLRFIFPVIPFILYFIFKGIEVVTVGLKLPQKYIAGLLVISLLFLSYHNLQRFIDFSRTDSNLAYNSEAKRMYFFISANIPENEIIGFAKPRVLRLFTDRNSILSDLDHFDNQKDLSYLLIRKEEMKSPLENRYKKVYETENLLLVHR